MRLSTVQRSRRGPAHRSSNDDRERRPQRARLFRTTERAIGCERLNAQGGDQATAGTLKVSKTSAAQLAKNSSLSLLAYVVNLPVTLVVSRYLVHSLGLEKFGAWAALTAVMSFGGLLTLGVTAPLVKYTAEYRTYGDDDSVNSLINTGIGLYLAIGAAFALLLALASGWILPHLFHGLAATSGLRLLFFAVVVGFTLDLMFSPLQSLLFGLQRADLVAQITLFFGLAGSLTSVVAVAAGYGLDGLAASWFLSTVLSIAVNWAVARRVFPALRINPLRFRWSVLRKILGFSSRVQVTTVTLFLNDQVDRWLIAYALGPGPLGTFQLASRASQAMRGISFSFLSGIMPAGSDLAALDSTHRLRQLYLRSSRYVAILDFGLCAGLAALAGPLVFLWLGPGYGRVAQTMIVILAGYIVWLPSQVTADLLNGLGRPGIRMRADLAFLLIHIPLSVLLIWRFGYFGTVIGTAIALSITRAYVYVAGPKRIGSSFREMASFGLWRPALITAAALAAAAGVQLVTRISIATALAAVLAFAAVFLTGTLLFALDEYDRRLLIQTVRRAASLAPGSKRLMARELPQGPRGGDAVPP